ncbi:MAG: DPP IV N-terminal domain-containing protein [Chitinophagales bacterium]|nr:DPP IV N-terminal domain-containing protein [Chitinophagales bacterium]
MLIALATMDAKAQSTFNLEDIFIHQKFQAKQLPQMQFIDTANYITIDHQPDKMTSYVYKENISTHQKEMIFDSKHLKDLFSLKDALIQRFDFIDSSHFLIGIQTEKIYRRSSKAMFFYVDLSKANITQIGGNEKIMYPTIAPDQSKIAYIKNNNIFIFYTKNEKTVQITKDGQKNFIINGACDWVYEEEFGMTNTMSWSPDSKSLMYLKTDESKVKQYSFDLYYQDYPITFQYKYPRAGEDVSTVSLWVYQSKKKHFKLDLDDTYIPLFRWKDNKTVAVLTINRLQNDMKVFVFDIKKKAKQLWYREEDKRYVELPSLFTFLPTGELAITSEKMGYNHLYFVNSNANIQQITQGNFDVSEILRIDLEDSIILFSAHLPQPECKSLLSWNMKNQSLAYLSDTTGTVNTTMLGNGYFLEKYSSSYTRNKVSLKSIKNLSTITLINDQREEDSVLIKKDFFWLPINNYLLRAWKMLPPGFDSKKSYPVLFYVYGGSGSSTVNNEWDRNLILWLNYMAHQGYIVVSVNNRGTGRRGTEFKKISYSKLGYYEVEDQLESIKYFSQLPYVDKNRIAMMGWSYGGYMTLMSMMSDTLIQKGISIAPVTDWKYYDAIYTERYMRTPIGNPTEYIKSSPIEQAEKLSGDLLLIHGTADDNVHYQNSMELAKKLIQYNKKFQMLSYPNSNHGIGGSKTQLHLFETLSNFLLQKE